MRVGSNPRGAVGMAHDWWPDGRFWRVRGWAYRSEYGEETALPTASTVNRWALDEGWTAKADADLERSHGRTLYELQVGWLAGLRLAQKTLLDGMAGEFDDMPMGGAGRLKAAEITLRVIEWAGLLALLPQAPAQERTIDWEALTLDEQEAYVRQKMHERKGKT